MTSYRFFSSLMLVLVLTAGTLFPGVAAGRIGMRYSAVAPPDEIYVEPEQPARSRKSSAAGSSGEADTKGETAGVRALETLKKRMIQAWESDKYDIYLPAYTWHNRLTYDSSHINRYNENPWGGGLGRSFYDEDGDSHSLYFMTFIDSNDYVQPIGGYAYIKNWHPDEDRNWAFGLGYTLSLTGRHEYNYIPVPLPLPLVSVRYKQLAVQAAYIPGRYNDGNVLFTWLRWHLD